VSKVVIVAIAPVLELTPVQVIQARPTGSWVFVMDNEKGGKEFVTLRQLVWLDATHLKLPHQKAKLTLKHLGPFKITKEISPVAYQLALPINWRIHDIFHASLMSPYHEMTAHSPNFTHPPPDLIEGEEEYEVERIVTH